MHQVLEKEVNNLKKLAKKKGENLSFLETHIEEVIFISNEKRVVCVVLQEDEIHNTLCCYKVDFKKWKWAEQEGFNTQEHFPKIMNEVMEQLRSQEEYLSYLK